MPRYKLTLEYDGGDFVGWQRQANGLSVQETLEDAAFAFTGARTTIEGAGRTDAGVHAAAQVAHLDIESERATDTVVNALNFHLKPAAVTVLAAEIAPADFHSANVNTT